MDKIAEKGMADFLQNIGIDLTEFNMQKTPNRVVELYKSLFDGLTRNTAELWQNIYETDYMGLVAVHNIEFESVCEHHLMPFFGQVDIIYKPQQGRVVGLSKLQDLVNILAHRPQLQERLAQQIMQSLSAELGAEGVLVRIKAKHLCMILNANTRHDSLVTTLVATGELARDGKYYSEALLMLEGVQNEITQI